MLSEVLMLLVIVSFIDYYSLPFYFSLMMENVIEHFEFLFGIPVFNI